MSSKNRLNIVVNGIIIGTSIDKHLKEQLKEDTNKFSKKSFLNIIIGSVTILVMIIFFWLIFLYK